MWAITGKMSGRPVTSSETKADLSTGSSPRSASSIPFVPPDASSPELTAKGNEHSPHVVEILHERYGTLVEALSDNTICKSGKSVSATEAASMRFVAERTSIPIPCVISDGPSTAPRVGHTIIMTRLEGAPLVDEWPNLDEATRTVVVRQLGVCLRQLSQIRGTYIGSSDGTATREAHLHQDKRPATTLPNVAAFHDLLVQQMSVAIPRDYVNYCRRALHDDYPIVFAHADISPYNLLIHENHLSGIIDWDTAGFYPSYWEYVKMLWDGDWQSGWAGKVTEHCDAHISENLAYSAIAQYIYL
ncbi:kinase-like domain-containing protein [Amylocystis lapponica]|nr:kinase-like domain-containing protein [Amylocystis lapponica]